MVISLYLTVPCLSNKYGYHVLSVHAEVNNVDMSFDHAFGTERQSDAILEYIRVYLFRTDDDGKQTNMKEIIVNKMSPAHKELLRIAVWEHLEETKVDFT